MHVVANPPLGPMRLTFNIDQTTPVYKIVQMTLANGKTTQGGTCEICRRVIMVGSKGSLYAFTYDVQNAQKIITQVRKPPVHRARLPLIAQAPKFPLGIFRLGLDRGPPTPNRRRVLSVTKRTQLPAKERHRSDSTSRDTRYICKLDAAGIIFDFYD